MMQRRHDPKIDRIRHMLCSKNTIDGVVVLCDLLEPVIEFSDYLQAANIHFSRVHVKLQVRHANLLIYWLQVKIKPFLPCFDKL